MKRCILYILFFMFLATNVDAQYNLLNNNFWAMSYYGGIDFNGNDPTIIHTAAHPYSNFSEGCSSIADGEGHSLFYTNGVTVWNAFHSIMPHGDSLNGSNLFSYTVTQNSVIVPFVNDPVRYYLFIMSKNTALNYFIRCFIINTNLNNFRGDIETNHPLNGKIIDSFVNSEKMLSVAGCNNDVWLMVRTSPSPTSIDTAIFQGFHITDSGLNLNPIISVIPNVSQAVAGVLKINEQRTRLVECGGNLTLYKFNPNNGSVFDPSLIEQHYYYGAAWSPDGTKLYVTGTYQFDITASNILNTKTFIGTQGGLLSDLKLASNGKIYFRSRTPGAPSKYIACINQPNNPSLSCNFQDSVLHYTDSSKLSSFGLPNEIWIPQPIGTPIGHLALDTLVCNYTAISLHAKPNQLDYEWDDSTTNTSRVITQSGNYYVKYIDSFCNRHVDTFKVRGIPLDTFQILQSWNMIFTTRIFDSYQWYKNGQMIPGANYSVLNLSGDGYYSVAVGNLSGCKDSAGVAIYTTPVKDPKAMSDVIKVYPNPASTLLHIQSPEPVKAAVYTLDGRCVVQPFEVKEIDISSIAKGVYFIKITDKEDVFIKMEKIVKE